MTDPFDRELRATFDELRAADAATVPAFSLPRRRVARKLIWAVVAAAAVIVAATLVLHRKPEPAPIDITQWRAPTDVLLQMR